MTDTSIDLDALTKERAALVAMIDELTQRKNEIDDLYREHLTFGSHAISGLNVAIQHNRRLDPAAVMKAYPVTTSPELYRPAIDTASVKRLLAPADLESFYIEGAPKVIVTA